MDRATDTQFFADQLEQLDLALDQLALRDRNFDRFAIMLVDNVVELTLNRHAQHLSSQGPYGSKSTLDPKAITAAIGQHFEPKVKLAKLAGMLSPEVADSILSLHSFRNTAHHRGLRHEGILHSLALFYVKNACATLGAYKSLGWSGSSGDIIPHRAMKYLGGRSPGWMGMYSREKFQDAWARVHAVSEAMGDSLVADLHDDMGKTITSTDEAIQFLAEDGPKKLSRDQVIIESQSWSFFWTDAAKAFAASRVPSTVKSVGDYVSWLQLNYPWPAKKDPIPSWRRRLASLKKDKDPHAALKKYCDFMSQTESLRGIILEAARGLDEHIQQQIDEARGK